MALGAEQRLLLVLAVDLHQALAHAREGLHGRHLAVDVGARAAALGDDVRRINNSRWPESADSGVPSGSGASPSSSNNPSTTASFCPPRIMSGEARPPSSRPSAVMMMVLPAPVSPESTLRPGPK